MRKVLSSILAMAVLTEAQPSMTEDRSHVGNLKKKCEGCGLIGSNLTGMNLQAGLLVFDFKFLRPQRT
jgi:hypothetical protein